MNLVDPILFQCKSNPSALALCAPGKSLNLVTYRSLAEMIGSVVEKAHALGLERGKLAALFIKDPILHSVFILGLTKLGVVTVSASEGELPPQLKVDAVFSDGPLTAAGDHIKAVIDHGWLRGGAWPSMDAFSPEPASDEPCRIILSSGTTGIPKAVPYTSRSVFVRCALMKAMFGNRVPDCSRVYVGMGFSTGPWFLHLFDTLSRGGTMLLSGPSLSATAEMLAMFRVQVIQTATNALLALCDVCDTSATSFDDLQVALVGGSPLTSTISERIRSRLCSNLISMYAISECGMVATAQASVIADTPGAVGYVVPGVHVEIVDTNGKLLPAGEQGRVRVRSIYGIDNYFPLQGESPRFREKGFFPGDLGLLTPNGMLVIGGRENAVLNMGGEKVSPERVEAAITSYKSVRDAAAFLASTPVGARFLGSAVVWRENSDEAGLREHLQRSLPHYLVPQLLLTIDDIPRNPAGKIDRNRLTQVVATLTNEAASQ